MLETTGVFSSATESFLQGIFRALGDHELWDGCLSLVETMGHLGAAQQALRGL